MPSTPILEELALHAGSEAGAGALRISSTELVHVYPRSIMRAGAATLFLGRRAGKKYLYIIADRSKAAPAEMFDGDSVRSDRFNGTTLIRRCPLTPKNADALRTVFPFMAPTRLGYVPSFGFGDRLGLANPAHLQAVENTVFRPVLAQQSVRELTRTSREPDDVLAAATWAVFQEGYREGYGADGDHLKSTADIDRFVQAGYTMFTFDPSAFVFLGSAVLDDNALERLVRSLPGDYGALPEALLERYADRSVQVSDTVTIAADRTTVLRALAKYGTAIDHAVILYHHLIEQCNGRRVDVELSVDETDIPTTPFEHFFIVSELRRRGVVLDSLAPRFVGDFEKGIEYRGDLGAFASEYLQHAAIASAMGPYKISVHSGSDKFAVYKVLGRTPEFPVHIKTAGTSYLEALRTIATVNGKLFREILSYALDRYDEEKASYHVSAQGSRIPSSDAIADEELEGLLENQDVRQVLHVTFGGVLGALDDAGGLRFRSRIDATLGEHEAVHYAHLVRHFGKHLDPFSSWKEGTV